MYFQCATVFFISLKSLKQFLVLYWVIELIKGILLVTVTIFKYILNKWEWYTMCYFTLLICSEPIVVIVVFIIAFDFWLGSTNGYWWSEEEFG